MSKEEIALELTKLTFGYAQNSNKLSGNSKKPEEVVTDLYNYIFTHMDSEQSK